MKAHPDTAASLETALVVVLGMHRSGTSVITRAMETMGAEFGDNLMPAVAGVNDKGFFEDLDVYAINIELLKAAGADWHSLAPIDFGRIEKSQCDALRSRAIQVLRGKCRNKIFALKDPRIARLMPFWQPVFDGLGIPIIYVIAIRNPISVSRSLEKRDHFPWEKSHLLWLAHTVLALQATSGTRRVLVDYDRLMEEPRGELERISRQLCIPLDTHRASEFEKEFLDGKLQHTKFEARDLELVHAASRQVKRLFSALQSTAARYDPGQDPVYETALMDAQHYLEDLAPILRHAWQIEQQLTQFHAEIESYKQRVDGLQNDLNESRESDRQHVEALKHDLDGCRLDSEALQHDLDERRSEAEALHHDLDERRSEAEAAMSTIVKLNAESQLQKATIDSLTATIQSMDESAAKQAAALEQSNRTITALLHSTSWRITAPLRVVRRYVSKRES
ncbi:hypothetical protein OKW40_004039 [Paraburkholderia sp. RAU6.4a]|uniref:hypothetical protein n=1 Tax=Paraburkholderia sp. RAU6.4a TaxID=2991067 RepID=UPI003D1EFC1F